MRIWVDADACPRGVKEIIFRAAQRRSIETVLVANNRMSVPASPFVRAVRVEKGPDVADDYVVQQAAPGDLAITADIPLAAELVRKGLTVIDPRGAHYSEENVAERLATRDLLQGLRDAGEELGGPRSFSEKDKRSFANAFDRALTAAQRG